MGTRWTKLQDLAKGALFSFPNQSAIYRIISNEGHTTFSKCVGSMIVFDIDNQFTYVVPKSY
jgi:hypothetical protein